MYVFSLSFYIQIDGTYDIILHGVIVLDVLIMLYVSVQILVFLFSIVFRQYICRLIHAQ